VTTRKTGFKLIAGAGLGAAAAAALRRRWAGRRAGEEPVAKAPGRAGRAFLDHLAEAVRIPTISEEDRSRIDPAPFDEFHAFLGRTYPLIHERLAREVVAGHSLLFTWEGRDPAALPVLLMTVLVMGAGLAIPHMPFGRSLGFESPPPTFLLFLGAILIGYTALTQLVKGWYVRRFGTWL